MKKSNPKSEIWYTIFVKKLLLFPLLVLFLAVGVTVWFYVSSQPVSADKKFGNILITKGSSASQIGNKLQSAGFVKSSLAFKIYSQLTGKSGKIQAGEFRLSPSYSLFQTVEALGRGPVEIWVTIPEGLRREEVATKFAAGLDKDQVFVDEFLKASKEDEGMLFPDTYLFPKEASASAIVNKMTKTFESKTSSLTSASGLSLNQRLVLASLVERETKTNEERPVVAGILWKRMEK